MTPNPLAQPTFPSRTEEEHAAAGTPCSGGSAFTWEIVLGSTLLRSRISSIVLFQMTAAFDGNSILPDILFEPSPEYFISGRDNVLEEAVKRIKNESAGDALPLSATFITYRVIVGPMAASIVKLIIV